MRCRLIPVREAQMNRKEYPHTINTVTACEALGIVMAIIAISLFLAPKNKRHLQTLAATVSVEAPLGTCGP